MEEDARTDPSDAGGLSMMFKDDYLNPHIDNSHDGKRDRYRRLNRFTIAALIAPEFGGILSCKRGSTVPKTLSRTNRLVVMETNKTSWHSVSHVTPTAEVLRTNYYFSKIPDHTEYFHVTRSMAAPGSPKRVVGFDNALRNIVRRR